MIGSALGFAGASPVSALASLVPISLFFARIARPYGRVLCSVC